jgi:polysaccharide export outer membrane protein
LATVIGAVTAGAQPHQQSPNPRPGDVIRLRVWREPDMSGEFQVNESGEVTLPQIGTLHVSGISPDSLRAFIVAKYAPALRNPSIEVTVLKRVRVVGAVKNPGLYPVDDTFSVGDVLAAAGGITTDGDRRKVRLARSGEEGETMLSLDARIAESPVRSGDQIEVLERSWLSRNATLATTIASSIALIVITVARR